MINLVKTVSSDISSVLYNTLLREKERAVAQGENTAYAGCFRLVQAAQTHLYTFDKVIPLISHYSIRAYSMPLLFTSAVLTMGLIGTSMFFSGIVPNWVEKKINDHAGTFFQVAMIVQALFVTCFGSPLSGSIALTFLAYEVLTKNLHLIPHRFTGGWVEQRVFRFVRSFCGILSQQIKFKVIGIIDLINFFDYSSKIYPKIFLKFEDFCCSKFNEMKHHLGNELEVGESSPFDQMGAEFLANRLSLKQLAAPGREGPFSYRQILEIMEATDKTFSLSSAHFPKGTAIPPLFIDKNFEEFNAIFAAVLRPENSGLLYPRCKSDARFRSFLLRLDPEEERCFNDFKKTFFSSDKNLSSSSEDVADKFWEDHFQRILKKVADKKGVSGSDFILNWCKEQATGLVDRLCQKKGFLGDFLNDEDGHNKEASQKISENCGKILHFLKSLELPKDKMAYEDCVINLATRVGEYCAEGAYLYTQELVETYLLSGIRLNQLQNQSNVDRFETTIYDHLVRFRKEAIQEAYQSLTLADNSTGRAMLLGQDQKRVAPPGQFNRIVQKPLRFISQHFVQTKDIHTYNFIAGTLAIAFRSGNLGDFRSLAFFLQLRAMGTIDHVYRKYQESIFSFFDSPEVREGLFSYVNEKVIQGNPLLSEAQKEEIMEKLSADKDSAKTYKRFLNLALVQLKIMQ